MDLALRQQPDERLGGHAIRCNERHEPMRIRRKPGDATAKLRTKQIGIE
jgi:hypothetical protein